MTEITIKQYINHPQETVWEIIADLSSFADYHPYLTNSAYTSEQRGGVGARRICEIGDQMKFEETVMEWYEGQGYMVSANFLAGQAPPIRDYRGTLLLKPFEQGTVVSMASKYQPKYGVLGLILDALFIKRAYKKTITNILAGLNHHIETGEMITQDFLKRKQNNKT